jgi:hypothetical protein
MASKPRRVERWENEGGAVVPPAHVAAGIVTGGDRLAARPNPEQPRLYADLLAEADRRRQATDDRLVRGMIALRDLPR